MYFCLYRSYRLSLGFFSFVPSIVITQFPMIREPPGSRGSSGLNDALSSKKTWFSSLISTATLTLTICQNKNDKQQPKGKESQHFFPVLYTCDF